MIKCLKLNKKEKFNVVEMDIIGKFTNLEHLEIVRHAIGGRFEPIYENFQNLKSVY